MTQQTAKAGRLARILLVEDDEADRALIRRALAKSQLTLDLEWAVDGEAALDHLRRTGTGEVPRPDLVLLDLNLPGMNGHEVLSQIREDPWTRDLPVVILTTSESPEDVKRSYTMHANAYVTKPVGMQEFTQIMSEIEGFWFSVVILPPTDG